MTKETDIRIRLRDKPQADFKAAKAKLERELGIDLRDNEFARRVVERAVKGAAG